MLSIYVIYLTVLDRRWREPLRAGGSVADIVDPSRLPEAMEFAATAGIG